MANTPNVGVRVDPALVERVRVAHGLKDANASTVLRYCLALAVGHSDPVSVAYVPMGHPPRRGRTA